MTDEEWEQFEKDWFKVMGVSQEDEEKYRRILNYARKNAETNEVVTESMKVVTIISFYIGVCQAEGLGLDDEETKKAIKIGNELHSECLKLLSGIRVEVLKARNKIKKLWGVSDADDFEKEIGG